MEDIQQEIVSALQLILERKRISIDLLKAHFGSFAKAAIILSILEMKGFITKPKESNRWEINFDIIKCYLEKPIELDYIENKETKEEPYLPKTIKNGDLQNILDKLYLANPNFNITNILTTDLTVTEIDTSLETIKQARVKYKNEINKHKDFIQKSQILQRKLLDLQNTEKELKNKLSLNSKSISNNNFASYLWGIFVFSLIIALANIDKQIGKFSIFICLSSIIGMIFSKLWINKQEINMKKLEEERENGKKEIEVAIKILETNKKDIEQEQEILKKSYNLGKNVDPSRINAGYIKSFELEGILKKMKVILTDTQETSSNKIIALEELLYLTNKKYIDEAMLEEQKMATNYAEKQAEYAAENLKEMKKQSHELEAQNDMLTLQTYNKVSEMQGIDPILIATQTYANVSKIQKDRDKEK